MDGNSNGAPPCRHLHGVASRIIHGVAAAFFTSVERCYCIIIQTDDDSDDQGGQSPLISATKGDEDGEHSMEIEIKQSNEAGCKDETSKLSMNK